KGAKPSNQSLATTKSPLGKPPDKLSSSDLVALLDHPNSFQRRELWPLLGAHPDRKLIPAFKDRFASSTDEVKALEALWAVYLCGGFDDAFVEHALSHPGQSIR